MTRNGPAAPAGEDLRWLDSLEAAHRTAFDAESHRNGHVLVQAGAYLDAWREAFHVPEHDVKLVVGLRGTAVALVLGDALWSRYRVGERLEIDDAARGGPARRNIFLDASAGAQAPVPAQRTVEALQRRGVLFLACRNALSSMAQRLAQGGSEAPDEVGRALVAGLVPGTIAVPALVVALTQLQERRVAYVHSG